MVSRICYSACWLSSCSPPTYVTYVYNTLRLGHHLGSKCSSLRTSQLVCQALLISCVVSQHSSVYFIAHHMYPALYDRRACPCDHVAIACVKGCIWAAGRTRRRDLWTRRPVAADLELWQRWENACRNFGGGAFVSRFLLRLRPYRQLIQLFHRHRATSNMLLDHYMGSRS